VLLSILTLFWQLFIIFSCCLGVGLALRFLLPKESSLLNKLLFTLMGGLFLVVLIPQNLVYLAVPVRISAWLILGAALVQVWLCRRRFGNWAHAFRSNADIRALASVILLTITLHGVVPIRQGLEWYYGNGHFDQINYVLLAEFLKDEPYSTSEQDIGLRPWLVRPVGFQDTTGQVGVASGPGVGMIGLKNERIGQSIVTAEISLWLGTDAKEGYAATVIFYLTLLAICVYVLLRETGIDSFMAASGGLLAAFLPVVTRLSLDGFLSQISILFVFPFFASLLRHQKLSPSSFTLFFSLSLAYVVAAYSEIAPIGLCTFFLGVMLIRDDQMRPKRLMLMSAILIIALVNPYYLRNLIGFLGHQYKLAADLTILGNMSPKLLTLRGWSELIFGVAANASFVLFFDYCALLIGVLFLAGAIFLSRRDRLIFGAIVLPHVLVILYLATRTPLAYYPIAKITLTLLPLLIGFVFVALSKVAANNQDRSIGLLKKLFSAIIVAAAAAGSVRYYSEVLNTGGLLRYAREPHFLNVCRELGQIKNKRVLVFETHPLLTAWLCYHARQNDVYFDGRLISDSPIPPGLPFSKVPDLQNIDFVATRDRIVNLRSPSLSCLTSVDDTAGEDRTGDGLRYWLGPPARLRFLALRPMTANLKMRLALGREATTLPIHYFLTDAQGQVFQGELWSEIVQVSRMSLPRGLSFLELSVKAQEGDPNAGLSFPVLAELDGVEISDIDLNPGK
jgi:hypothetical protein